MVGRLASSAFARLSVARLRPSSSFSSLHYSARVRNSEKPPTESKKQEVAYEKPLYVTKSRYDREASEHRLRSADADSGHRPTAFQRQMLVVTGLYKKKSDIPELVPRGTMNRYHDRMRVVFIVVASFIFFTFFYITESLNARRIERDRRSGKNIT